MKAGLCRALLTASCVLVITACSNADSGRQAESLNSQDTGAWDADSRNNENATLGAKSIPHSPTPSATGHPMDRMVTHYNGQLMMREDLANQIVSSARLPNAAVAVTNQHVYVAVDLEGQQAAGREQASSVNESGGAGIFGTGVGSQLDWSSGKPFAKEASVTIYNEMRRLFPNASIYTSTNPNFVNRMLFYNQQQKLGKDLGVYVNEFNTMVQYAFPE
jgi:hypothetical protein